MLRQPVWQVDYLVYQKGSGNYPVYVHFAKAMPISSMSKHRLQALHTFVDVKQATTLQTIANISSCQY